MAQFIDVKLGYLTNPEERFEHEGATHDHPLKQLDFGENEPSPEEVYEAGKPEGEGVPTLYERCGFKPGVDVQTVSWDSVQDKAPDHVKSIFKNFKLLGDVLDRHEATIHRRWMKKSNKLRRALVHEAWGAKMALSHRPDFEALELEDDNKRFKGTAYRDSYLWPYINEEDLCRSRSLLLLMSTRSRCRPNELAISEYEAHRVGRGASVFGLHIGRGFDDHILDLTNPGGEDCYGRLWSRSADPDRFVALRSQEHQQPIHGFLVLEAQERILSFLVKCAKLILHDLTEVALLESPIQPFTKLSKPDSGYASLATVAAEAPYQRPDSLDFSRIASLLAAKHDHMADHIWSLREDPEYYEAHMLECMEHQQELLVDRYGRQHPICSKEHEDKFWARVVAVHISRDYFHLEYLADLVSQANALENMQKQFTVESSTSPNYPEAYTAAILLFREHLMHAAGIPGQELGLAFPASPPVRRWHRRREETDFTAEVVGFSQSSAYVEDPVRARIHWLILRLRKDDILQTVVGATNVVDELHRLIDAEPAKSLISTYINSVVSDLAIYTECVHQLELYQPWTQMHGQLKLEQLKPLEQKVSEREKPWMDMWRTIDHRDYELGNLGKCVNGKFAYPIAKRRTRENVETMRSAERNLDKLWRKVDRCLESKSSVFVGSAVHRLLTQDRRLQRTPEWVEPVRASVQPSVEELYIPFSQLFFDHEKSEKQAQHECSGPPSKEKIKTRRPGYPEIPTAEAEAIVAPAEAQNEPHFDLNARALRVFKTLFFTPSMTSTPGEVAWADFLYAMVSVGFIPEKLYGSIWQFSPHPDKLTVVRSIQFHEPHGGNSKIPYWTARRHGRRLNRAYGWQESTFTLEEKSKSK